MTDSLDGCLRAHHIELQKAKRTALEVEEGELGVDIKDNLIVGDHRLSWYQQVLCYIHLLAGAKFTAPDDVWTRYSE